MTWQEQSQIPGRLHQYFTLGKRRKKKLPTTGSYSEQWVRAAEAIIHLCQNRGFPDIKINIADERGYMPF
jgi:hypothetical protein